MLRRLRLVDFKSFRDEAVELAPLTLLLGANASGKSNCLDALRFLHQTIADQSIVEILDGDQRQGVANAWQGLRGGSKEASRVGAESFLIESTWDVPEAPYTDLARRISVVHRIRCQALPRPTWEEEGALHRRCAPAPGREGDRTRRERRVAHRVDLPDWIGGDRT
jgi:energy-coupling factor transporter ATP-binding protein EcfA2